MLTLFANSNHGGLYLYDWVDKCAESNRWLIYNVTALDLYAYLRNELSHFDLFNKAKGAFFFADIGSGPAFNNYEIVELSHVPDAYVPNFDSHFDREDCPDYPESFHSSRRPYPRKNRPLKNTD